MNLVISYIESTMWACRAQEFDAMCRIAYRESDKLDAILAAADLDSDGKKFESMLAKKGERLNGTRYTEMRENSVAVIDVSGVLAKRMSFFAEVCGNGTSTELLMRDIATAVSSANVSSIVLNIDSPGGEAMGINELAQAIYEARSKKPIEAYVSGLGCSGAYWIASACDKVTADKGAFLGSIGVVTSWTDDSGFYKSLGIRREVITSSNAQFKRLNLDKDEHRTELMRELDSLESIFHKAVARNRGVSVKQVIEDFNHGGVLTGVDAVKAKMADRTGSLEQVIKELAKKGKNTASLGAENTEGEFEMGFKEDFKAFAVKHGLMTESDDAPKTETETAAPDADNKNTSAEVAAANQRAATAEQKLAAMEAQRETEKQTQVETAAASFVTAEVSAGRMFPAEKEVFQSLYIQAAADDAASPLATGSRLDNLKTIQEKRKPHGFDVEQLDPKGVQIISGNDSDEAKMEREAIAQATEYVGTVQPKLKAVN